MQTLHSMFHLLKLCTASRKGKEGIFFFIAILALNILGIQLTLKLIYWNKDFYNALEKYDTAAVVAQIGVFALLTALSAAQYLSAEYLRGLLQIRWRKELTNASFDRWFQSKAYWHMNTLAASSLDNPDQRVAEDCRIFVDKLTSKALELITKTIGLITYFIVLWNISTFPLSFTLWGYTITITHYMVWAAPIYVFICSGMTHWLGAPLMKLGVEQQHKEADFRFALTRFRESKEAIALQNGEVVEQAVLNARFEQIIQNWRKLIKRELILGCFTRPYMSTILRVPVFLALPAYLVGHVTLGTLMQISSAFQNVATSLSWFIFSYRDLAELAASSVRLEQFLSQAEKSALLKETGSVPVIQGTVLKIDNLKLFNLDGRPLICLSSTEIEAGTTAVFRGASGIGKSTLMRAMAGLHHQFSGTIIVPENNKLFLPQKVYFPLGGLADAVCYPKVLEQQYIPEIKKLLEKVGFNVADIEERLVQYDMSQLSGGEQQRVVFARILYNKPDWLFMDECTNALDKEAERFLLQILQQELPHTTRVIISHSDEISRQLVPSYKIQLA